ncbi:autotransporter outer membrane beta-barrel domain-containing protein [Brucella intermedia]|uniref:autotransporter outer membrane beta-barrel domain-containing protein n=1 Tax=Brucella intermedia TaxID=94625 RepID=UPI00244EA4E2|nr:autotransporter outer membrane beta-barrel domain-containing protein [Brucella intermedia]WGJ08526.1 autotransporter outer membrane beta-barrel domain-containing protein [Brucella intermedia]
MLITMHNFDKNDTLSRLYSGTALVSVLWLVSGLIATPAQAACTGAAGIYSCNGALTDPVTINDTNISITTQSGFGIAVTGQYPALSLIGAGFVSYQDDNLSPLSGAVALYIQNFASSATAFASIVTGGSIDGGIIVDNGSTQGDALTEIALGGLISADRAYGIFLSDHVYGGNNTIHLDATDIKAGGGGISTNVSASNGDTLSDISVSGTVSTLKGEGIYSWSSANGGNSTVRIKANEIHSGYTGIRNNQDASGGDVLSEISVSGTISALNGNGILSSASATGGNSTLRLNANEIHSGLGGIFVDNSSFEGDALTEIVVAGKITADQGGGIENYGSATDGNHIIRIQASDIQSNSDGVNNLQIAMRGDASTAITTTGTVSSDVGYGIYSTNMTYYGRSEIDVNANNVFSITGDAVHVQGFAYDNASAHSTINITTAGDVSSEYRKGIHVETNDADTYLTVSGLVHGGGGSTYSVEPTAIDVIRQDGIERSVTLELRPGYALEGITRATVLVDCCNQELDLPNTHLVLGGSGTAELNLSRIDNRETAITSGNADRITGFGTLTKLGDSIWTLNGANSADPADGFLWANVNAGILALDNADLRLAVAGSVLAATGTLTIENGAALSSIGSSAVDGQVYNSGSILLSNQYTTGNGISSGDTLAVTGNYTGNNGMLTVDTVLGDDNSSTDRLFVGGDTSGTSFVKVFNDGGTGAQTSEGIKIIEIAGNSGGSFTLLGDYETLDNKQAIRAGAYAYTLEKNGVSNPTDGDWYLRSSFIPAPPTDPEEPEAPRYQAGAPVYEAYPQSLLALNGVSTLQQRVGNRVWAGNGNRVIAQGADAIETPYAAPEEAGVHIEGNGVWGRVEGAHNHIETGRSTTGVDHDQNIFKLQAGVDGMFMENESGKLIGGVSVHYAHGLTKTASIYDTSVGGGRISTEGYGLGGSLTWYGESGFYVDAQAQATWYNSDLSFSGGNLSLVDGNDGFGYALSIESGKRFALDPAWSLTPQAQLVYSSVDFDDFREDMTGTAIHLSKGDSLQGRIGLTLDHESAWQNANGMLNRAHVYGIANLYYEFLEGTKVEVADVSFANRNDRAWGGVGLGGSYNWNDDKYSIYGEGLINTSLNNFADSYSLKGNVGFRVKW